MLTPYQAKKTIRRNSAILLTALCMSGFFLLCMGVLGIAGTNRHWFDATLFPVILTVAAGMLFICAYMGLVIFKQIHTILVNHQTTTRYLKNARQALEMILQEMPVGIALIGPDMNIRKINKAALALLGVNHASALLGRPCGDHLCSMETALCPMTRGDRRQFSNECYLKTQKGSNPAVLRKMATLQLNDGPVILETFVDITERKTAEQTVIENGHFINTILNTATVGIIVTDASNNSIMEANPAACKMIGALRETLIGSFCDQYIHQHKTDAFSLSKSVEHPLDDVHAYDLHTVDGRCLPIIRNAATTFLNGRMLLVESFVDITRIKQAEAKMRQLKDELENRVIERTSQLEKANTNLKSTLQDLKETQSLLVQSEKLASIGQLAAGVAHEINNPVGFVKSNMQTIDEYRADLMRLMEVYERLRDHLARNNDTMDDVKGYLSSIFEIRTEIDIDYILDDFETVVKESSEGLERVTKIVADLKHFACVNVNDITWADLNEGLESTLNMVWNQLKYKADIIKDFGKLPLVRCFRQRINQVFMNLLVNAGQAIAEKGTITIKTRAAGDYVTIIISDTGEGIPPEVITRIFDPFFTTKEVGQGAGLGLHVVYNIVQTHHGSIDVKSSPGKGTRFTIRLPVALNDFQNEV